MRIALQLLAFPLLLTFSGITVAQSLNTSPATEVTADGKVYYYVEKMPEFHGGGTDSIVSYLRTTLHYPPEALSKKIEGKVFVSFVVTPTGAVDQVKVSKGTHALLDAEALRVIQEMPVWAPGIQAGKPVNVGFTLPITFQLPQATTDSETPAIRQAGFPGGPAALQTYLKAVPLPTNYQTQPGQPARVFVSFVVDTKGRVTQVEAVQPPPPAARMRMHQYPKLAAAPQILLDAAVEHIKSMPNWTAAQQQGKATETHFTVPVTFANTPASSAYAYADQMPVFPAEGGELRYMAKRIRYPASALRSRTQGTVLVYYEVSEEGRIENVEIIRSVSTDLDGEVLRIFNQQFPTYQPAQHQGKPVRVFYVMPSDFAIK